LVIFGGFLWIFVEDIWGCFFAGFVIGVIHEDLVPLFLVISPLQILVKAFDFGGFRGSSSSRPKGLRFVIPFD
jgi:hypothetical protein